MHAPRIPFEGPVPGRGKNRMSISITIAILLCIVMADYAFMYSQSRHYVKLTEDINSTGRLRMLSQRAALLTGQIMSAHSEERSAIVDRLRETYAELQSFKDGSAPSPVISADADSEEIDRHSIYYGEHYALEQKLELFLLALTTILSPKPTGTDSRARAYTAVIRSADTLLAGFDAIVSSYESEARATVERTYGLNALAWMASLGGILTLSFLVFRPIAMRARDQVNTLEGINSRLGAQIEDQSVALSHTSAALDLAEARFSRLSDASPIGIFLTDNQGHITYVNPRWQSIAGLDKDSAVGTGWINVVHPDDRDALVAAWQKVVGLAEQFNQEFRYVWPDGSVRWGHSRAAPLCSEDGRVTGYVGTTEDVTDRRAVEDALRASENRFARAVRGTEDGLYERDVDTGETYYSPRYEELLGYEPGELTISFDAIWNMVHPDDLERVQESYDRHIERGERYDVECRMATKQGIYRWFNARGLLETVVGRDCERRLLSGSIRDITDRKSLELERSILQKAVESAPEPIFRISRDLTIEYANAAACTLFGYSPRDMTSMSITQVDLRFSDDHPLKVWETGTQRGGIKLERQYQRCDGTTIPVETTTSIFEFEGKDYAFVFATDITARKRAADALQKESEALSRSNAELEQFAYLSSHDLQEPLRKIQAFGDRLQNKYGDTLEAQGRDYLRRIRSSAQRMQTLIEDLLSYSRVSSRARPFQSVDLNDVMQDVVADLDNLVEREQGKVDIDRLPTIDADPTQIRQLLQNLVANALKFHKPGKDPHVHVWMEESDSPDAVAASHVRLLVEDNGIGLEAEYAEKIFQPFQRLHGRTEYAGNGIGLALCRKIARRHGGDIDVRSQPDNGSVFVVTLQREHGVEHGSGTGGVSEDGEQRIARS